MGNFSGLQNFNMSAQFHLWKTQNFWHVSAKRRLIFTVWSSSFLRVTNLYLFLLHYSTCFPIHGPDGKIKVGNRVFKQKKALKRVLWYRFTADTWTYKEVLWGNLKFIEIYSETLPNKWLSSIWNQFLILSANQWMNISRVE